MDDATKGWVVDGSYSGLVGDIVLNRTDTLLYLKISRLITIPRVLRRGFGRWLHRELLWGVNRETPINTIKLAFWVFTSYKKRAKRVEEIIESKPEFEVHVFTSNKNANNWLAKVKREQ
jgi:hypothetical protein